MKLKLMTRSTEKLKETLLLITHLRKFVILKFSPEELSIISVNGGSINSEPQVWCKLPAHSHFEVVDVQSMRDNIISMEINIDLLLQTLRNFDKANSEGLNIRLQRTDTSGEPSTATKNGRTASLALFYSNTNVNCNIINHTFRIPVKILREAQEILNEPVHRDHGLIMRLPSQFVTMFKRLEKFKRTNFNDRMVIQASRSNGGSLRFILEEDGKFKVTISWNDQLEVHKTTSSNADSMRESLHNGNVHSDDESSADNLEELELGVKLKDWQQASRIVGRCRTVILYIAQRQCSLHCLLDDTDDVELIYFINGVRSIPL
ncbi:MEC3 [Candida oxycetoniae]|uniref:Checkpoint protein n=1 Tax=Candida oxycetoniae TaxID=497107 RepID=A0AAI9WZW4_9ASCO|nr:MEC3 [Candida oxycetoniae]KAI3406310.2 MEC3 [Candida oxycetoniae]